MACSLCRSENAERSTEYPTNTDIVYLGGIEFGLVQGCLECNVEMRRKTEEKQTCLEKSIEQLINGHVLELPLLGPSHGSTLRKGNDDIVWVLLKNGGEATRGSLRGCGTNDVGNAVKHCRECEGNGQDILIIVSQQAARPDRAQKAQWSRGNIFHYGR